MQKENRIALLCVVVWFGFALLATLVPASSDVEHHRIGVASPVEWPLVLKTGDVLVSRVESGASTRLSTLDIKGVQSGDLLIRIGVNGAWPQCSPEPRTCRLLVESSGEANVYMTALAPVVIERIDSQVIRHHWSSVASSGMPLLLVGVVLMIPLSLVLHGKPVLQRRVLLSSTLGLLVFLQPAFTLLLLVMLVMVHRVGTTAAPGRGRQLVIALSGAALVLLTVKYAVSGLHQVFANPGGFDLLVPLGISYIVIRVADTQIRWYRNQLRDAPLDEFLFFVFFPATLTAGPVDTLERFRTARAERVSASDGVAGVRRVGWGFFKKIVIADALLYPLIWGGDGLGVQVFSSTESGSMYAVAFLFAGFAYVYVDFSAYSDIAIGLSRLLGWSAPENFNFPFLARSIMDYWRRWHMSVSGWCMRNIYMPLLLSTRRPAVASLMVMLGVGMWHSIGFSWMLWALHHGVFIAVESEWSRWRRKARVSNEARQPGWRHALLSLPARLITLTWVAAGHSFAQIHDPVLALDVYARFWREIMVAPLSLFK